MPAGALLVSASAIITWLLGGLLQQRAELNGLVAGPNLDVPMHDRTVPLVGGLAMLGGVLPMLLLLAAVFPEMGWLVVGLLVLASIGLVKDRVDNLTTGIGSAAIQAGIQGLGVLLILQGTCAIVDIWDKPLATVGFVLLGVTVINAWNFLDVSDALAGGVAVLTCLALAMIAKLNGDYGLLWLLLSFAAALAGFLVHNRPPAKIFMGDVGSFTIAGVIGFGLLRTLCYTPGLSGAEVGGAALILFLPALEFWFTVASRSASGRPAWLGDNRHLSLTLLRRGWPVGVMLAAAYAVTAVTGIAGVLLLSHGEQTIVTP